MRVYFDHRTRWRLFGANQLQVIVSTFFSELEETIIEQYGLGHLIVLERRPTIYRDANGVRHEIDHNIYLKNLLKHAHVEEVASPTHALAFQQEFLAGLDQLKRYLNVSTVSPKDEVYEL
jgi:hypothetical protein